MVPKVLQNLFKYVQPKGTILEMFTCRNFGVPLGAHTLYVLRKPALLMMFPKTNLVNLLEG